MFITRKTRKAKEELAKLQTDITRLQTEQKALEKSTEKSRKSFASVNNQITDAKSRLKSYFDDNLAYEMDGEFQSAYGHIKDTALITKMRKIEREMDQINKFNGVENWYINDSASEGRKAVKQTKQAMLAFYDSMVKDAIDAMTWRNGAAKLKFIETTAVNRAEKLGKAMSLWFNYEYINKRVELAEMTYQARLNEQAEREAIKEQARTEREQRRLEIDAQKALKEEQKLQTLLDKARAEQSDRVAELEAQLAEAHAKTERAKSMAEQTKRGFVYIISNAGAFGEDVVKIGLTRRLDPFDRVKELGDASVPFRFDTHAMIYSEDAPALEAALHRRFQDNRVNMVNNRKEFFHIDLNTLKSFLTESYPTVNWWDADPNNEFEHTKAMQKAA
ncbi:GIY-YIG nuclease family protein [Tateyamaria sp. Alg231-49]|uniref:GIY-YIG nuclease family protein n=1 Tax=Tateyamaria sp. Alg231-49 TaxID=1922219 RepID=UPI000D55F5BB|nr:GIY-YIG nuclease family protein [Tateyamaria sp. Alg231-49]